MFLCLFIRFLLHFCEDELQKSYYNTYLKDDNRNYSKMAFNDSSQYATIDFLEEPMDDAEIQPAKFHGISVAQMGNTRKNPMGELVKIANDPTVSLSDRMVAVRYMDKIPHVNKFSYCFEAVKLIIECEELPIGERYFFFSNTIKRLKLSDQLVKASHEFFFTQGIKKPHWPLILKLLSAGSIYMSELHHTYTWKLARQFIQELACDPNETVRIRGEAADMLARNVTDEDGLIGRSVIVELGELYAKNKFNTIYTSAQSAHDETITESVMGVIRTLLTERNKRTEELKEEKSEPTGFTESAKSNVNMMPEQNTGHIMERILVLTEGKDEKWKDKILQAINFIIIHPAKYEGVTPSDILCLVWNKIRTQPTDIRKELEQRLLQELFDMIDTDGACATGLVTRLVNVMTGYIHEEGLQIRMNIKDQLRSNVFGRLQTCIQRLPRRDQDTILAELADDKSSKETAKEFIESYSVKDELQDEFVIPGHINQEDFNHIYNRCIADFLGLTVWPEQKKTDSISITVNDP